MNTVVRRKLEMVARVREFVRSHSAAEASYAPVLARLEERLSRVQAIATRQHRGLAAARAGRAHRRQLRRVIQLQLLHYLTSVGSVAAKERTELSQRFRLPRSGANSRFLIAVKALIALGESQKDLLVELGMKPELLGDLNSRVAEFESAVEATRTARRDHIGARAELEKVTAELLEQVKVLDGITRYRFGMDAEMMAEWQAVRRVPGVPSGAVKPVDARAAPAA